MRLSASKYARKPLRAWLAGGTVALCLIQPITGCGSGADEPSKTEQTEALPPAVAAAKMAVERGRYQEARETIALAMERHPRYPDVYVAAGDLYVALNLPAKADSAYRKALTLDPQHPWASLRLGNVMFRRSRFDDALEQFKAQLETNADPDVWHNVGAAYLMLNHPDSAVSAYQEALDEDPDHAPSLLGLATVYETQGDLQRAVEHQRRASEADPDNLEYRKKLGILEQQVGASASAISHLVPVVKAHPWDYQAYYALGRAYQAEGLQDRAAVYLSRADEVREAYGDVLQLERAALRHPEDARAQISLAEAYANAGRLGDAVAAYERARVLLPDEPAIIGRIASLHLKMRDPQRAAGLLDKALSMDSSSIELWLNSAIAHAQADNPSAARRALAAAETLRPRDPRVEDVRRAIRDERD